MKFFLLLVLTMLLNPCLACVCDEKPTLSLQVCSLYDVIFSGDVQNTSVCEDGNSKVLFNVSELYKGDVEFVSELQYVCGVEDCSVDFHDDSEWLIFAKKNNAQECIFELCSYSRELLPDSTAVYINQLRGSTFFQDKDFLASQFDIKKRSKNELRSRKYEKVDPKLIPVFLGVSLLFMLGGMFVFKRVSKKKS
ncbi:MAG: hypothetical protein ACJA0Q_001570 [Saprospiraceae bacterium]|jgi:hypothetical protein